MPTDPDDVAALLDTERALRADLGRLRGEVSEAHRLRVATLVELRRRLSVQEMADALGVSRQQVYRLLRGE